MHRLTASIFSTLFGIANVCLMLRFLLGIFYPGSPETMLFFVALGPVLPWLDVVVSWLTVPVDFVLGWLVPLLPAPVVTWFPVSDAAGLLSAIFHGIGGLPGISPTPIGQGLMHVNLNPHFPGVFDWTLLLSAYFWHEVYSFAMRRVTYPWRYKAPIHQTQPQFHHHEPMPSFEERPFSSRP